MDFGEVKVHERRQNAGPCGRFTVQAPEGVLSCVAFLT